MHMVELSDGMSVGFEAEDAAVFERLLVPAPIKIEPPRMRIDLDGDAVLCASFQDFVDIDFIAGTPLGLAFRHCDR